MALPEHAFDRSWAEGMIERAVAEFRAEYEGSGRGKVFAAMAPLIWGTENDDAIAERAAAVDLTPNAFRVALHRDQRVSNVIIVGRRDSHIAGLI